MADADQPAPDTEDTVYLTAEGMAAWWARNTPSTVEESQDEQ